jgi:hypothetical protein
MSDTFLFKGRYQIKPPPTNIDLSGDFEIVADIQESLAVSKRLATVVSLAADPAETVNMADITSAAIVIIKSDVEVIVRLTTTAGATQAIGGVKFMMLKCEANPVTAITLQRNAGVLTTCRVTLAEV